MAFLASSSRVMPSASLMIFWVGVRLASSTGGGVEVSCLELELPWVLGWLVPPLPAGGLLLPQAARAKVMAPARSRAVSFFMFFILYPPSSLLINYPRTILCGLLILLYLGRAKMNRGQICAFLFSSAIFVKYR